MIGLNGEHNDRSNLDTDIKLAEFFTSMYLGDILDSIKKLKSESIVIDFSTRDSYTKFIKDTNIDIRVFNYTIFKYLSCEVSCKNVLLRMKSTSSDLLIIEACKRKRKLLIIKRVLNKSNNRRGIMTFNYQTNKFNNLFVIKEISTGNVVEITKLQAESIINKRGLENEGVFLNTKYSIRGSIVTLEDIRESVKNIISIDISDLRGIIYNYIGVVNVASFIMLGGIGNG